MVRNAQKFIALVILAGGAMGLFYPTMGLFYPIGKATANPWEVMNLGMLVLIYTAVAQKERG
jgi:hypothetical protein